MNEAIFRMLGRYGCQRAKDDPRALREILQGVVLLGLWRGDFFERAALTGGAALRLLHGLGRFEADLDFTLLASSSGFPFAPYAKALIREIRSLGFRIRMTKKAVHRASALESAFLKANTLQYTLEIETVRDSSWRRWADPQVRIRIEIETDPPPGALAPESRACALPIPFSVRTLALPDLLALKLAGLLRRRYYRRAKGRDWYDLIWFAAAGIRPNLAHLEARLRQRGELPEGERLTGEKFRRLAARVIRILDVEEARREVLPYLSDPGAAASPAAWSPEFFRDAFSRIAPPEPAG